MAIAKYLKIGRDRYAFRSLINETRYQLLKNHPQSSSFHFKRGTHLYKWYVKNSSGDTLTTTQKEQIRIQKESYAKWLNTKTF